MAIDWGRTYSARLSVYRVDRRTWADAERIGGVVSASIVRSAKGGAPALESGSFAYDGGYGDFAEEYHRVYVDARQGGVSERAALCTMLCSSRGHESARGNVEHDVVGAGVLSTAGARRLLAGAYAPMGADGAEYAGALLRECLHAPVLVEGGFTLEQHVVFDFGCTYLEAAWLVLRAGNHVLRVEGDGTVRVVPMPERPAMTVDREGRAMLHDGISAELDMSGVPNRYVALDEGVTASAVNDDPASPVSTAARGYVRDMVDDSPVRVNGETLDSYAARRLAEESVVGDERTYSREYSPDVLPFDVVRFSLPSRGVVGDYRVASQSVSVGRGLTVKETATREVRLWNPST